MDQELHRGLLLIFRIESVCNLWGNRPGGPQRTSAYTSYQKCMESVGQWTRSSTEVFCSYSILEVSEVSKKMYQELHRGLLLIFIIGSVWKQLWNGPGAPQRASAYIPYWKCVESIKKYTRSSTADFCLHSWLKVCEISREMDQELHRGLLFIFTAESVPNQ